MTENSPSPDSSRPNESCGCEVRDGIRVLTCGQHDDPDYRRPYRLPDNRRLGHE